MLLADKEDLQRRLKLQILQIEEKELNHYTTNSYTLGTQAALLAGFAFTVLIEAPWYRILENAPEWLVLLSVLTNAVGMLLEMMAVVKSVQLAILGPKLALRGPDGSVSCAVLTLRRQEQRMHRQFYAGLVFFHFSAMFTMWAIFPTMTAAAVSAVLLLGFFAMQWDASQVSNALLLNTSAAAGVQNLWLPDGTCTGTPADARGYSQIHGQPPSGVALADVAPAAGPLTPARDCSDLEAGRCACAASGAKAAPAAPPAQRPRLACPPSLRRFDSPSANEAFAARRLIAQTGSATPLTARDSETRTHRGGFFSRVRHALQLGPNEPTPPDPTAVSAVV